MPLPATEEVNALFPSPRPDAMVEAAIADADLMLGDCGGYDDARRNRIVKYLAAHLLTSAPGGSVDIRSESADGVSVSYGKATLGEGLRGSSFGQTAMTFDIRGCLANLGKVTAKVVNL